MGAVRDLGSAEDPDGSAADEMEQIMAQLRRASSGGRNGGRSVRGLIDPAVLHAFLGQLGRRGFRGGGAGTGGRRGDELDTDNRRDATPIGRGAAPLVPDAAINTVAGHAHPPILAVLVFTIYE